MPTKGSLVSSLETPTVCALAGVKPQTLDYWARTGLVSASIRPSSGRRVTRLWSVKDVITVRAIKALRDAGCSLTKVRDVKHLVQESWGRDIADCVLFWDGRDILCVKPWGEVESALRNPGQQVLHLLALPLEHWVREVDELALYRHKGPSATRSRRDSDGKLTG